ncbi:TipAS antibiotic-recognition domain-containing protein [Clostridium pasteurianum]|uniref:TipAS antibiotic-recognition domain-containing protein n=1 Tax=Clostridium pasteurianum TaxID=1501 RepID=UPI00039DFD69|nr:TipAS antibiotic-recognition domain-containing protein [Clostridium pasteurianum]
MKKDDIFVLFDKAYMEIYNKEQSKAEKKKYMNSVYKEIYKKVSKYTKEDWKGLRERLNYIYEDIIILMDKSPAHEKVQQAIEELRKYYSDSFYNCNLNMFRALGKLYIEDENFREKINQRKEGLAEFLSEAIEIYCYRSENNE